MERRYWSNEEKLKIVKEALETGNCSVVADRRQIAKSLVARWVRAYKEQTKLEVAALYLAIRMTPTGGGSATSKLRNGLVNSSKAKALRTAI